MELKESDLLLGRPMYYLLDERDRPYPVTQEEVVRVQSEHGSSIEWRRVAKTELPDGRIVSTIFYPLDMAIDGPPVVFETAVQNPHPGYWFKQYSTIEEALIGHEECVAECLAG
jgi:hypothetical protein